jgi:hypothetical protein
MNDIILEKLNQTIINFLNNCSIENTPTVCNFISTTVGKEAIIELIKKKIILQNITIGEAVIQIEREYNPNSYTE